MNSRRTSQSAMIITVGLTAVIIEFLLGWINIHSAKAPYEKLIYCLIGLAFAYVTPKLLWLWPMVFAVTLYAVHIWAIRHGYHPPYVDKSEADALNCLIVFFPALFGGFAGGGIRAALDWSRKNY